MLRDPCMSTCDSLPLGNVEHASTQPPVTQGLTISTHVRILTGCCYCRMPSAAQLIRKARVLFTESLAVKSQVKRRFLPQPFKSMRLSSESNLRFRHDFWYNRFFF